MVLHRQTERRLRASVPLLPSIILALALVVLGWPSRFANIGSVAYPALLAAFAGLSLYVCTRLEQPFVATLIILTTAAYAPGLGNAVVHGALLPGAEILPDAASTRDAVWMLLFFLAVPTVVSWLFVPAWQAVLPRVRTEDRTTRRGYALGLGALIVLSFIASLNSGAWTDYGGATGGDTSNGAFRLAGYPDISGCRSRSP